jgi:hypothetical protein
MPARDFVNFKAGVTLVSAARYDDVKRDQLYSTLFYYETSDLEAIARDIHEMAWIWRNMINYLREKTPRRHAELYRQIWGQKRVPPELERLRGEKNLPTEI